jgi:RNA polymerase sigma-70 factor (ECF subfamily)
MLKVFDKVDLLHNDARSMERILRRIASNAAINAIRQKKNFIFSVEEIPDNSDWKEEDDNRFSHDSEDLETDENDGSYQIYEDSETEDESCFFSVEEIMEAVSSLSDGYRNILTLRLFEEMSFAEIAGLLKIRCSTARVQYMRGITKLKDLLKKKRNDD